MFGIDDIIGGGLNLVGGVLGDIFASGQQGSGEDMIRQILQRYNQYPQLNIPQVSPAMQGASAFGNIQTDPNVRGAQVNALNYLQDIGQRGGLDPQAQSDLAQALGQTNAAYVGRTGAIQQNLQSRGLGQGGLGLANQQLASQGAAGQQQQAGLGVGAGAQQRALSAMMNAGGLGGQIRSQDFGEAAAKAQAADTINRFNTQNLNQSRYYNSQIVPQQWNANLGLLNQQAGAMGGVANVDLAGAQRTRNLWGGLGQGFGNMARGAFGSGFGQTNYGGEQDYFRNRFNPDNVGGWGGGGGGYT